MYKIIGADQREYGPVSADQVREWIAQGRANGQTLAQNEGGAWNPLSAFPEFAAALAAQAGQAGSAVPPISPAPPSAATPQKLLEQDYRVDVFGCVGRAWDLIKEDFASIVGTNLLVLMVTLGVYALAGYFTNPAMESLMRKNFSPGALLIVGLGNMVTLPIYSILYGGLYWFLLKKIRGEPAGVEDAFAGFRKPLLQLALLGIVKGVLTGLGFLLCVVPGIYLAVAWTFSEALVVDKQLGFWEAMELGRKLVTKHWLTILCLVLVVGIVSMVGVVACCVGILVTIPIGFAAMMFAYEDIFRH